MTDSVRSFEPMPHETADGQTIGMVGNEHIARAYDKRGEHVVSAIHRLSPADAVDLLHYLHLVAPHDVRSWLLFRGKLNHPV